MDLTTLAGALLLALGLLGANAVMHANSVIVDVSAPPKTDKLIIDQGTLEREFDDQLFAIANTPSIVEPPEIHASHDQGIGMALAREAKLQEVAYALQNELGYNPDKLRLALFLEVRCFPMPRLDLSLSISSVDNHGYARIDYFPLDDPILL